MKFALMLLLAFSSCVFADEILRLGSPPPELKIERWMRGEPIMRFEKDKVYIVEFWATWCGPCVRAMPHLMEYQREYADQGLRVVGIANREQESARGEAEGKIESFLKDNFPDINYAIGFEHGGVMNKLWMEPGLGIGIPYSFVIDREGKIAYIGHPHFLEDILPKIMAGTWSDSAEARIWDEERMRTQAPAYAHDRLVRPFYRAITAASKEENWDKALSAAEAGLVIDSKDLIFLKQRAKILLFDKLDVFRGLMVMKEFVDVAKKSDDVKFSTAAMNLLFGVEFNHAHVPQKVRLELGDQLAPKILRHSSRHPGQEWKDYPSLAQYFWEKGERDRALHLSQTAVDSLKNESGDYRDRFIKVYGQTVAQQHANLIQEPVCIGDICVLPKKCADDLINR